jgi:hypothetical protein
MKFNGGTGSRPISCGGPRLERELAAALRYPRSAKSPGPDHSTLMPPVAMTMVQIALFAREEGAEVTRRAAAGD